MLEAFGVSPPEEKVYLFLLSQPRSSQRDIVEGTDLSPAKARAAITTLETKGMVSRGTGKPPRFVPSPPNVALQGLVYRRLGEIEDARSEAEAVMDRLYATTTRSAAELAEVITGEDPVHERTVQMLLGAEEEVLELSRPPYLMSTEEMEHVNLSKGVRYRYVYAASALEVPGKLEEILADVELGEQARILPDVPLKLSIVDRKVARMFLSTDEPDVETGILIVRASPIIDALLVLFDSLWRRATPLGAALAGESSPSEEDEGPSESDRILLTLLASGVKDETIARHLGITTRSLRRRMTRVMDLLDARSRFQAGLQASRRGWVSPP